MKLKDQPLLLSSALVLSLIGGILGMLLFWGSAIFFDPVKEFVIGVTNLTSMDKITPFYFVLFGALCLVSFVGVLKMKRLQKAGFFFYLGTQLAMLFLPVVWLNWNAFSVNNTIFTLLFVLIYLSFYRRMN
ncbi:MAG TPA: hypothetical protein VKA27_05335 [Sunxiuqinia sp.]|nr:hypothetical protein [Sunxiuqinia sp.]